MCIMLNVVVVYDCVEDQNPRDGTPRSYLFRITYDISESYSLIYGGYCRVN